MESGVGWGGVGQGEVEWSGVQWSAVECSGVETLQPGSVETLAEEGTWWYFLADKPHSSWKPRQIKEEVLPWQNYPPWIDTYPHPKVISDTTSMFPTSKAHYTSLSKMHD